MLHGSELLQPMLDQLWELREQELRSNQKLSDIDREIAKLSAQNLVLIRLKSKTVCGLCGAKLLRGNRTHGRVYWHCQNPDCGQTAAISDGMLAGLVDRRLRELARSPELLTAPEAKQSGPDLESIRLQNELTQALNRGGESPAYIRSLILRITAQRYAQLSDPTPAHDLEQLRERLEAGQIDTGTLSGLLATAVQTIRLGPDKSVVLELVNGTVIAEAEEDDP